MLVSSLHACKLGMTSCASLGQNGSCKNCLALFNYIVKLIQRLYKLHAYNYVQSNHINELQKNVQYLGQEYKYTDEL